MGIFSWRQSKKKKSPKGEDSEMSFFDHLEELRWHLMRSVIAIVAVAICLFIFRREVIGGVFMSVFESDFITFKILCNTIGDPFCNIDIPVEVQAISPYEQFMKALVYSFFGGLIIAFPYVTFEMWRFIRPALSKKEVRKVRWNVVTTSILFFIGVFFGYFIILPISVHFLSNFVLFENAQNIWRIGNVISFELMLLFGTGFLFQMPLIVFYLSRLEIVTPKFLKRYRRHAIVILLLIAALITPPDPFSQILIFLPLIILYEIGIFISKRVEKKKARERALEESTRSNSS